MAVSRVSARSATVLPSRNGHDAAGVPFPAVGGLARVVINDVHPQVDGGRRPAKAAIGQRLRVHAEAFTDGHDAVFCELRTRHESAGKWTTLPMHPGEDDRWLAEWPIAVLGWHRFAIRAAVDPIATWRRDLAVRVA